MFIEEDKGERGIRIKLSKPRVKARMIEEGYKQNTRRKERNDKRRMCVLR